MKLKLSENEIRALKLKDLENLSDSECSTKMNISTSEFEKLILETRKKIINTILKNGKITYKKESLIEKVDTVENDTCFFRCGVCGFVYSINYKKDSIKCPLCYSDIIMKL